MLNFFLLKNGIEKEIQAGASFESVKLPLKSLDKLKFIHFYKKGTGPTVAGLGVDRSRSRAYLKSVSEFYERKMLYSIGSNYKLSSTNGIAANPIKYFAVNKAKRELVERDAFFSTLVFQNPI